MTAAVAPLLTGRRSFAEALAEYQRTRDAAVTAMYEFTLGLASLEPPPPEMQQVLAALPGNQEAMDGFVSVMAGTLSPADYLAPQNLARILSGAG